jgi:succinyl-CoA:acetate CoA-transferase
MMIDITERIRSKQHRDVYMTAAEAARLIHRDDIIGLSSFTPCGYPKAVPLALARRIEKEHFRVQIWAGGALGDEIDGALSRVHGISRRYLFQSNPELRRQINSGEVAFSDMHISAFPQYIRENFFGQPDIVIVEAVAITADGALVPATSIGLTPALIDACSRVIVEVNVTQPLCLEGMHDVYSLPNPPYRKPIPICHPGDRIGTTTIPCGWDKIIAIVPSDIPDTPFPLKPTDEADRKMGQLLVAFFHEEVQNGRLPAHLLPLQSGVGSVSNAIIGCLAQSEFEHLSIYTEVLQDGMLDLIDAGKMDVVSTGSISTSPQGLKRFYDHIDFYKKHIIIRPVEITNNPEVARRLGSIAMNTAIECDIYGNVNSTHICGTRMMNGIGGSGDFARSAYLTIFCTPSVAKGGNISTIVPMCSHVDHPGHDVDIICTEQGLADLRGLCPVERARAIIANCAHPAYRDMLTDYLDRAIEQTGNAHIPHILTEALSWHQRYIDTGTMKR